MQPIELVRKRDDALTDEFLDLILAVVLPVLNIRGAQRSQGSSGPDGALDARVIASIDDSASVLGL